MMISALEFERSSTRSAAYHIYAHINTYMHACIYSTGTRTMASALEFERDAARRAAYPQDDDNDDDETKNKHDQQQRGSRGVRQPITSRLLLSAVRKASSEAEKIAGQLKSDKAYLRVSLCMCTCVRASSEAEKDGLVF
jgi:hypothetical protein